METNEPYQHILKQLSDIKEEGKKGEGAVPPPFSALGPAENPPAGDLGVLEPGRRKAAVTCR